MGWSFRIYHALVEAGAPDFHTVFNSGHPWCLSVEPSEHVEISLGCVLSV